MKDLRYLKWDTNPTNTVGTPGVLLKAKQGSGRKRIYYKLSTGDVVSGIYGHESANEVFVSRLLTALDIPHVEYHGAQANITLNNKDIETYVCWSREFKHRAETKMAFDTYFALHASDIDPLSFLHSLGLSQAVDYMLLVDFLIINRDRHGANVEILLDSRTDKVRLAPIYDNGFSLVSPALNHPDRVEAFDVMRDVEANNFIGSRSLFDNLELISKPITVNKLTEEAINRAFYGLRGILTETHISKIREIIIKRYEYAKNKKVLCER